MANHESLNFGITDFKGHLSGFIFSICFPPKKLYNRKGVINYC